MDKTMDRTMKANIIIHGFAVAAAACSAVTALVPFFGPLAGDTIALTTITIAMTLSLANLFDKQLEEGALWSFGTVIVGMVFGVALAKGVISLIPGAGSAANAAITFTMHEAIGWGLFLIFERGGDPTRMSKKELDAAIKDGKEKAKKEKEAYERMLNKLSPEARAEVERLQKEMADKNISEKGKQDMSDRIVAIFEKASAE